MTRASLILVSEAIRERAVRWIRSAPAGTRLDFRGPQRTLDQNARMWAMLTDIASQKEHAGQKLTPDTWKIVFLHALGQELRFIPSLDGKAFLPLGMSSSRLSKAEMSELIELLFAWGAENGVTWSDPTLSANAARAA